MILLAEMAPPVVPAEPVHTATLVDLLVWVGAALLAIECARWAIRWRIASAEAQGRVLVLPWKNKALTAIVAGSFFIPLDLCRVASWVGQPVMDKARARTAERIARYRSPATPGTALEPVVVYVDQWGRPLQAPAVSGELLPMGYQQQPAQVMAPAGMAPPQYDPRPVMFPDGAPQNAYGQPAPSLVLDGANAMGQPVYKPLGVD